MKTPIFSECRRHVPYEDYFSSCKKSVCGCESGGGFSGVVACGCKALEAYAEACLSEGVAVHWLLDECGKFQAKVLRNRV